MVYKILYLYPDLLDLYGDSGNIEVLKYRLKQRGIECVVDTEFVQKIIEQTEKISLPDGSVETIEIET